MFNEYYEYKDNIYCLLPENYEYKCKATGFWVKSVGYFRLDNDKFRNKEGVFSVSGLPNFCRDSKDFYKKFNKIPFIDKLGNSSEYHSCQKPEKVAK